MDIEKYYEIGYEEYLVKQFFRLADRLDESHTYADIYRLMITWKKNVMSEYIDKSSRVRRVTYAQFDVRAVSAAVSLENLLTDSRRGSFVGLKLKNCPDWPAVFWGLLMAGYKPVMIDPAATDGATARIMRHAGGDAVVAQKSIQGLFTVELDSIEFERSTDEFSSHWEDAAAFCTSGTTGEPRIFVFDGESMSYQITSARVMPAHTADIMYPDRLGKLKNLALLPFYHVFGFVAVLMWYTFFGRTIVYTADITPNTVLSTCRRLKVSHIYGVPLLWNGIAQVITNKSTEKGAAGKVLSRIVEHSTNFRSGHEEAARRVVSRTFLKKIRSKLFGSDVRYMISGGGYLSPEVISLINALGYPLYNGYGLTEAGVVSVELTRFMAKRIMGSVGRPLDNIEFDILAEPGATDRGELLIKGRQLSTGCMRNGEFIARTDEWFNTHDIAIRDTDGRYYILGRADDLIITESGENVSPDELEWNYAGMKNVEQLCILGMKNALGKADIVMVLKLTDAGEEALAQLKTEIDGHSAALPFHKRVMKVYYTLSTLSTTNSGKVQRTAIAAELERDRYIALCGERRDEVVTDLPEYTLTAVRDVFSRVLMIPAERIRYDDDFVFDLGGDSFSYATLISEMETRFSVVVPATMYARYTTVTDFARLINESSGAKK